MMQGPNGQAMNGPQMNMPMGAPNMMPGKYVFHVSVDRFESKK